MSQDMCEKFAAKPGMSLSKELVERLITGRISQERIEKYETNWINKLAKLDEDHTRKHKLCIQEAEPIIKKLEEFATGGTPLPCPEHRTKVMECYEKNHGQTLLCSEMVEAFTNCVDDLLSKSCRGDNHQSSSKKLSYVEKFASNFNSN